MDKLPPGTYLKTFLYAGRSETQVVLYLLHSGVFLFIGSMRGFELTMAGGKWTQEEDRLILNGSARVVYMDCPPYETDALPFSRVFSIRSEAYTPRLEAVDGSGGWSLLSWAPLTFVGRDQLIDIRDSLAPRSWEDIAIVAGTFIEAGTDSSKPHLACDQSSEH